MVLIWDDVSGIVDVFVDPDVVIFDHGSDQVVARILIVPASWIKECKGEEQQGENLKRA